jgi:hypothetical protein
MTSMPLRIRLHTFPSLGGTRSSRPLRNVGSSIPIQRARQACPSEYVCTRFHHSEGRARRVRCATFDHPSRFSGHDKHAPPILRFNSLFRRNALLASAFRRDLLVRSVALRLIIHPDSAGTTSMPLRAGTTSVPLRIVRKNCAPRWENGLSGPPRYIV